MRRVAALLLVASLGCGPPSRERLDGNNGPADACDGLECRIVNCEQKGMSPTTISGTVFAPNGTLKLHGATVYIPVRDPGPLVQGATCSRCETTLPGGLIASALTDPAGNFTLTNVPAGRDVPVVIQIGKWRRQVTIPDVTECTDNAMPPNLTSLPKSKAEGDMPRIAIVTGGCDALECLVRKLGVETSEFTSDTGTGQIHMFASNGANALANGTPFAPASTLWSSVDKLKQYDIAMLSCECGPDPEHKPQAAMDAMKAYADAGGRLYLSHYHNIWIVGEAALPTHAPAVWPSIATCTADTSSSPNHTIDQINNPKGAAFATWMVNVQGSTTLGVIPIQDSKRSCTSIDATKAERWVYKQDDANEYPQNFQFTTPNEMPKEDRCGKVVFSDMHVSWDSRSSAGTDFPTGCATTPLTPQEKALAFMFFDIASCVGTIL